MAAVQEENGEGITGINVTPLVDITLVLLIIFMATAPMIVHRAMGLSLPRVANSKQLPTRTIQILLSADKSLKLNGQSLRLADLAANLAQRARFDPGLRVTLSADERVSWGDVSAVLDAVRGAGITRIATEVQPKSPPR